MKKYLYFLLTLCLTGMLMVGCNLPKPDPDDPTEETENPKAGDDGYWCWKVTTTIPMEGTDDFVTVEYQWETAEEIALYVETMNEAYKATGGKVTYEKSNAKDKNECSELDDQAGSNIDDLTDWKKQYEKAEPGIYMNGNALLAKGTDGSIFHIDDVTSLQTPNAAGGKPCIPNNWRAYDGKSSTYFFWMDYYNDNDGNWMTFTYEDTVFYSVEDKWAPSQLETAIDGDGGRMNFLFFKEYTKVEDAGNFEETYIKIAKRVQVCGPIVPPSKMVQQYQEHGFGKWRDDLYPADMEAKKYVFRYTGSGTVSSFEVDRVFEWGASANDPRVVWLPAPCQTDDVAYVIVEIENVSEADAKAFIDKVRAEGVYSRILGDSSVDGIMGFEADSWDTEFTGDGLVYPEYEIMYFDGKLKIEFAVSKVGTV